MLIPYCYNYTTFIQFVWFLFYDFCFMIFALNFPCPRQALGSIVKRSRVCSAGEVQVYEKFRDCSRPLMPQVRQGFSSQNGTFTEGRSFRRTGKPLGLLARLVARASINSA